MSASASVPAREARFPPGLSARPVRPLGRGSSGVLWLAHEPSGRPVAVKVLDPALGPAAREQLRREHHVLRSLAHPRVVRVLDVVEEPVPALVFEYVEGVDLLDALDGGRAPASDGRTAPERVDRLLRLLLELLDALDALHAAGLVHRDVKPANVRVTPAGSIKLLDLGLAVAAGARDAGAGGTLRYLAPEALAGSPPDPRADVYAVGAIAYEALSGEVPHGGEADARAFAAARLNRDPAPLAEAGLDPALARAVETLVARRPEHRPADAPAAAALLRRAIERRGEEAAAGERRPAAIADAPFAGRAAALAALDAAARRAFSARRPERIDLVGPEGAGKSRLAAAWLARLGGEAIKLAADGGAGGAPLAAFAAAVEELSYAFGGLAAGEASDLLWPSGRALAALCPAARYLPGFDLLPELPPLPPADALDREVGALVHLLAAAARRRPVALVIDRAERATPALLTAVESLSRRDGAALLVVTLTRQAGPSGGGPHSVPLAALDRSGLAELAHAALGAAPRPALVDWLELESGGLPGPADAALRAAVALGAITIGARGADLDPARATELVGARRGEGRLATLAPRTRRVLAAVAAAGEAAGVEEVAALAGVDVTAAARAVQEAIAGRLLDERGGRLRPASEALGRVLLDSLGGGAARIHARAASRAEARGDAGAAARHWLDAGKPGRAARHLEAAARAALDEQRPALAHRLASAGLAAPAGRSGRGRALALRTLRARAAAMLGRMDGAEEDCRAVRAARAGWRGANQAHEADWLALLWELARIRGGHGEIRRELERALARAEARGDERAAASAHDRLIGVCLRSGDPQAGEEHGRRAVAAFLAQRRHGELAHALNDLGLLVRAHRSPEEAARLFGRARRIAACLGLGGLEALVLYNLGGTRMLQWRYDEALHVLREALEAARRNGDRPREALIRRNRGVVQTMLGSYAEAARELAEARRLAVETGHRRGLAEVLVAEAALAIRIGDAARLPDGFDEALEAQASVSLDMLPSFLFLRAEARRQTGDRSGCVADVERARALSGSFAADWLEGDAALLLARVALDEGRAAEAARLAAQAEVHAGRSGDRAVAARAAVTGALAAGDAAAARRALAAAVESGEADVELEARAALVELLARQGAAAAAEAERRRGRELVERVAALAGDAAQRFRARPVVRTLLGT